MSSTLIHTDDSAEDAAQGQDAAAADSARLMEKFSIVRGGEYYCFDGYRYERLADALAYAQLLQARQSQLSDPLSLTRVDGVESTSVSDRQLMLEYSISFENGNYVFEGYRYERLIDAANYANHRRLCGAPTP